MSEPIALFGLTVKPGDVHRMDVLRDFRITNVSLGEHVKGNARVVVKVHLIPQSGHPITEEEELLEGLMDEDDDDEDDEEEDEEKEAARAMKQYPERTFVLCTLTPGKIEQVSVNIGFSEAEEIGFSVTGDNEVDLLGNYLAPAGDFDQEPYDSDDDSEIDSDEAGSFDSDDEDDDEYDSEDMAADGLDGILAEGDSEDEDDEDDSDRFENLGDVPSVAAAEKVAAAVPSKKRKALAEPAEADVSMASSVGAVSDAELAKAAAAEGLDVSKLSKAQRKRLNKKLKLASGDADASVASTSSKPEAASTVKAETVKAAVAQNGKAAKTAEKQTVTKDGQQTSKTKTASGLLIEVKKQGDGPVAKKGQKAGMRYIGKLTNGKVFDSNTKGKPFAFKLGKGEVIKAWDEGVVGMKVGEERRLTCPPNLAYGASGAPPDIPRNATLVFDIKLVDLK